MIASGMTMAIDSERVAAIIREVAAEAILPRFRRLVAADITPKGDRGDFATTADVEAERRLAERLTELLPGSLAVGEEGVAKRPELLAAIAGKNPVWIIDPLDGTHNFAQGLVQFTVMAALARAGEVEAAWIHDPVAGRTVMAERGGGAWEAGSRLAVAEPVPLSAMRGALYARAGRPGISPQLEQARLRFASTSYHRCAGCEYLALARGESHFALFTRLLPWDHAAGTLIHREAGGYHACLDGAPYRPTQHAGVLLLAPDQPSWEAIAALVLVRA